MKKAIADIGWEEFQDLHVKVSVDPTRSPCQWIYVVDDAWLHPASLDSPPSGLNAPVFASPATLSSADATQQLDREYPNRNTSDATVAKEIIHFISQQGRNCGVCFCSFEYFVQHYTADINQPQNAVLLDIKHQLRIPHSQLDGDWIERFSQWEIFNSIEPPNQRILQGYLLYLAMNLGRLSNGVGRLIPQSCVVLFTSVRTVAERDYASVRNVLLGDGEVPADQLAQPIFFAKRKEPGSGEVDAPLLRQSLKTLEKSLAPRDWATARRLWFADAEAYWKADWNGHIDNLKDLPKFSWSDWFPPESSRAERLKEIYCFRGSDRTLVERKMFFDILRCSGVGSHLLGLESLPADRPDILVPSSPSIFWIATFLDFLDLLKPCNRLGEPDRTAPILRVDAADGSTRIVVTLGDDGVRGMERKFRENEGGGAARALRHLTGEDRLDSYRFGGELGALIEKAASYPCLRENEVVAQKILYDFRGPDIILTLPLQHETRRS